MRVKIFIFVLVLLFLVSCKSEINDPYAPSYFDNKKPAQISFVPDSCSLNFYPNVEPPYDYPYATEADLKLTGKIYNSGELSAKNIKITVKIYDSFWNILWKGDYLFINPAMNISYLSGGETCDFTVTWTGLDIAIFYELDGNGNPTNVLRWDAAKTTHNGMTVTWENAISSGFSF